MKKEIVTFENFNEVGYLLANDDVREAVRKGYEQSGVSHFIKIGFTENRNQYMQESTGIGKSPATQFQCNLCNKYVRGFLPYKNGFQNFSIFIQNVEIIGSDVENHSCPSCGCHDRERHLKLYIENSDALKDKSGLRILHFAPENNLVKWLSTKFTPEIHIFADLYPMDNRYEAIDIERIPYSDNCFDLVIANHILEHVKNPRQALYEINRILKSGGYAILQTPYARLLTNTFEESCLQTPEQRLFFYGQEDHVRLFGTDIFSMISEYLDPFTIYHNEFFDESIAIRHGVNPQEPFFLFKKN
jgi:hypothetical protein